MKQKITLRSFEVSRFSPVIRQPQSHPSCLSCPRRCPRRAIARQVVRGIEVRYSVAALRRSWRALAQMPPLFTVTVPQS